MGYPRYDRPDGNEVRVRRGVVRGLHCSCKRKGRPVLYNASSPFLSQLARPFGRTSATVSECFSVTCQSKSMDRIEVNPAICSGKPVTRGTRIMVSDILGMRSLEGKSTLTLCSNVM